MSSLDLQCFSYDDRTYVLPELLAALADSGGWILDRRPMSANMLELKVEIQLRSILDLYAAIVGSGLEMTRSSHLSLTDLCTCRRNTSMASDLNQIVSLRMGITFLEDVTLHSLLIAGGVPA